MSKRALTLLFAVYYLCLSIGVNISAHYCGGDLVNWTLAEQVPSCDGCDAAESATEEEDSCCKEQHQLIKKSGEDLAGQQIHIGFEQEFVAILPALLFFDEASEAVRLRQGLLSYRPAAPPGADPPAYILFGNFRV